MKDGGVVLAKIYLFVFVCILIGSGFVGYNVGKKISGDNAQAIHDTIYISDIAEDDSIVEGNVYETSDYKTIHRTTTCKCVGEGEPLRAVNVDDIKYDYFRSFCTSCFTQKQIDYLSE